MIFTEHIDTQGIQCIRHFHIPHNTPCFPPKFCISIVFSFSWDDCNTQGKWKTKVMQILGGKQGVLWGMWKW